MSFKFPLKLAAFAMGSLFFVHAHAGDLPNGRYTVVAVHSGKCVDVAWAGLQDGANIQQTGCNGNTAQVFDVIDTGEGWYKLTNINSGKVMDVAGNSTVEGANVQQWSDNGTGAQRFAIRHGSVNAYTLTNKTSGKCVDVVGAHTYDGANVAQWWCAGVANQNFTFKPVGVTGATVPNGRYTLKSVHSGLCLDVSGMSSANGANIQQWSCNGAGAQAFNLIAEGGNYHLLNAFSGKAMDVKDASKDNGANVQQWDWLGVDNQRFTLVDKGNGQYEVRFKHSAKCLDVAGWSTAEGGNVLQWTCGNSQANQKWVLTPSTWTASGGGGGGTTPTGFVFSPYKDITINMDWNTNIISSSVTGTRRPVLDILPANNKALTWAFATGECGSENWGGLTPSAVASANVQRFVSAGKRYIISTGGAAGSFTCGSDAGFDKFIKTYYSANMIGVDFDIEAGQSQVVIDNLVQRAIAAQRTYPTMRFSFTLATLAGNSPQSLGSAGIATMNAIKRLGLRNYIINLMVMDYGTTNPGNCVIGSNNRCDMGKSANQAAINLHSYYSVPYSQIELTPMIGGNDTLDETFTLADVATVATFAKQNGLAGIHHWSLDRDNDCAPGYASPTCNSYGQAGTLGFTNRFLSNLGL